MIELAAGDARATVDSLGSRLVSMVVRGDELLVQPGDDPLLSGCYPMVPWAGRLGSGRFTFDDAERHVPVDHPPHAIHGLGTGAHWQRSGDTSLALELGDRWPLCGRATTTFDLEPDGLTMTLEFRAGASAAPVVLGWHPCFRRRLEPRSSSAVDLTIDPAAMWQRGSDGLPTGDLVAVPPGPWDDCFIGVSAPPRLRWPGGPTVELVAPTDTWVVFDERYHAVCVEPQTGPPDAFNLGGAARLEPGQSVSLLLSLRWAA